MIAATHVRRPHNRLSSRRELAGVAGVATRRRTSKRSTFPHPKRECADTRMPTSKRHPLPHRTRSRVPPADPCPSEHSSDACPATRTRTSKCAFLPLERAPATEPRPQVPAVRAASSPPVLRAGPPVAPVPRVAPPPSAVQAPQPLVPDAHSTQAPQVPFLIDLRVAAPPSRVPVDTPPPLSARAVPPLVQEPASDQQHLAPVRKKARVALRIVDGNAESQCSATAYGGHGATVSATRERRKPARCQQQADAAPASIALSSSAATTHRMYCYAVALRAAEVQKNFWLLHTATSQENSCVALAPLATSKENSCVALAPLATSQETLCVALAPLATSSCFAIARVHRFKERVTECTSMCTLAPRGQIPVTARIASPSALNSARPARGKLFTSRAPPVRDDLLATSVHSLSAAAPLVSA